MRAFLLRFLVFLTLTLAGSALYALPYLSLQ